MKQLLVLVMISGLLLVVQGVGSVLADDDHDHDRGFLSRFKTHQADVQPVSLALYQQECGDCHFAYQPGWLPARSWRKIMTSLDDHFGDNAELDPQNQLAITDYLETYAADRVSDKRSRKLMRFVGQNDVPLRISTLRYIKRKHHEVPAGVFKVNEKLTSLSACAECHQQAVKGVFDEDTVKMPGKYAHFD